MHQPLPGEITERCHALLQNVHSGAQRAGLRKYSAHSSPPSTTFALQIPGIKAPENSGPELHFTFQVKNVVMHPPQPPHFKIASLVWQAPGLPPAPFIRISRPGAVLACAPPACPSSTSCVFSLHRPCLAVPHGLQVDIRAPTLLPVQGSQPTCRIRDPPAPVTTAMRPDRSNPNTISSAPPHIPLPYQCLHALLLIW